MFLTCFRVAFIVDKKTESSRSRVLVKYAKHELNQEFQGKTLRKQSIFEWIFQDDLNLLTFRETHILLDRFHSKKWGSTGSNLLSFQLTQLYLIFSFYLHLHLLLLVNLVILNLSLMEK